MSKFYVYDGGSSEEVNTIEEGILVLTNMIDLVRDSDDEWPEWVEDMFVAEYDEDGKIVAKVEMYNVQTPVGVIDEGGYDEEGYWFGDAREICDFKVVML